MKKSLLTLLALVSAIHTAIAAEKPNIVFVFADDLTFESIGAYGLTDCKTPNLDRLVKNGASFTHAYNMGAWGGAVCVASRAMINSGAFVNRAQAAIKEKPHWSEMMKQAGYKTYMTGKWHVPGAPRFDVVKFPTAGMPKGSGYNRPKSKEDYENGWKPWDKKQGGFWEGGTHWSEVVANHSLDFIKQAKEDDKPFFMYLSFNASHDPRQSPKEYIDMYPLDKIKLPKNYLNLYPYKDEIGCGPGLRDEKLAPFPRTEFAVKVHRQEYFAIITHMDAQIGRILDALEATGKADNTYIIFTADHGLACGHHGLFGKQNMYDHSMRVPFMISGPGIKPGSQFDMPIYLQDAMATSLDLASIEKPEQVEFKSLMPLIKGEQKVQYESIYGKYINLQRMIAKGDWKLIAYPKAGVVRLFNTKKDPDEMNDLASKPEYAPKIKELKAELKELQKAMGDTLDIDKPAQPKKKQDKKGKKAAKTNK
ncbi:choline-sulfatase [Oceaniferula spumae]|uniref:Choline-sulfatase n=1 Tax=Oceaniferula spumae TaxID=2979115 RepID=A0AAT9FKP3_9BACT